LAGVDITEKTKLIMIQTLRATLKTTPSLLHPSADG